MLLQAYDFLHLFQHEDCVMQAGGSDQWGNITAGVELIRRATGQKAHGLVYPLITKADGSKFGKTEQGTVWLSPERTSPYRFYQFWLNTDDADVVSYLKIFTWLEKGEIDELQVAVDDQPEQREAQRALAQAVTRMIHGDTAVAKAQKAANVLFGGDLEGLDGGDIADIFADVPSSEVARDALGGDGMLALDLLAESSLASSRGDAKRTIKGGGAYLNNERISELGRFVTLNDAIDGRFVVLRKGRKKYHLVKLLA